MNGHNKVSLVDADLTSVGAMAVSAPNCSSALPVLCINAAQATLTSGGTGLPSINGVTAITGGNLGGSVKDTAGECTPLAAVLVPGTGSLAMTTRLNLGGVRTAGRVPRSR
jgi:hypothetical protein